ncbi:MAG TPA: copper chaperone PCu(A)C [Hyphomicrobiaceae bacterium]|nr:copper chaperone PCu(A)C [Hyphomicrobiaceae bacterium]
MNRNLTAMLAAGAALLAGISYAAARPGWNVHDAGQPSLQLIADKVATPKTYRVGALVIEQPWARATPGGAAVGGGYLKITNTGREPDRLVGGSLPIAGSVEVHEMAMSGNVMKMRKLENGLEIKPGQTVELKPGAHHLMFMNLHGALKAGETLKGTLKFQKAGTVSVEFRIAPIGAQSVEPMHMHH